MGFRGLRSVSLWVAYGDWWLFCFVWMQWLLVFLRWLRSSLVVNVREAKGRERREAERCF